MTHLLLAAATSLELRALRRQLRLSLHPDVQLSYLVYGVGIPLSMYYLSRYLNTHKVDMLVCLGLAGCFEKSYPLGSVVVVERDCFGDMGSLYQHKAQSLFEMGWLQSKQFPFHREWLINRGTHLKKIHRHTKLPLVRGTTVQQMTDDTHRISNLRQKYQAEVESMEGASVHFLCLMNRISFIQIRALSNDVGVQDKAEWRIKEALQALTQETKQLLEQYFI